MVAHPPGLRTVQGVSNECSCRSCREAVRAKTRARRRHPTRQIDHDPGKFATQLVKQDVDCPGIDSQLLGHRRFGGQNSEVFRNLHHRPLDKQAVDARGLFERIGQPAAGVGIELQGDGTEMQIEIEQRGGLVALFR